MAKKKPPPAPPPLPKTGALNRGAKPPTAQKYDPPFTAGSVGHMDMTPVAHPVCQNCSTKDGLTVVIPCHHTLCKNCLKKASKRPGKQCPRPGCNAQLQLDQNQVRLERSNSGKILGLWKKAFSAATTPALSRTPSESDLNKPKGQSLENSPKQVHITAEDNRQTSQSIEESMRMRMDDMLMKSSPNIYANNMLPEDPSIDAGWESRRASAAVVEAYASKRNSVMMSDGQRASAAHTVDMESVRRMLEQQFGGGESSSVARKSIAEEPALEQMQTYNQPSPQMMAANNKPTTTTSLPPRPPSLSAMKKTPEKKRPSVASVSTKELPLDQSLADVVKVNFVWCPESLWSQQEMEELAGKVMKRKPDPKFPMCPMCGEDFLDPTFLSCSHTMCMKCVRLLLESTVECGLCAREGKSTQEVIKIRNICITPKAIRFRWIEYGKSGEPATSEGQILSICGNTFPANKVAAFVNGVNPRVTTIQVLDTSDSATVKYRNLRPGELLPSAAFHSFRCYMDDLDEVLWAKMEKERVAAQQPSKPGKESPAKKSSSKSPNKKSGKKR